VWYTLTWLRRSSSVPNEADGQDERQKDAGRRKLLLAPQAPQTMAPQAPPGSSWLPKLLKPCYVTC
jgi:hypothetical protein